MSNLLRVHIIKCYHCYDLGYIIDRFDHSKRARCHCRAGDPPQHWPCPCLAEQVDESENGVTDVTL
jgi:hypothetical protein